MENFIYKLNKYTIKLNKFINNNELIENNFDKYLLYLNKFKYYYNLTGGKGKSKEQVQAASEKVAKAAADRHKGKKEAESKEIVYNDVKGKDVQIATKTHHDDKPISIMKQLKSICENIKEDNNKLPTDIMDKLKSICKSIKDH